MSSSFKPQNFATMSPYLTVRDVKKSIEFYSKAFGFETRYEPMDINGECVHTEMYFGDASLMLGAEGAFGGNSLSPVSSQTLPSVSMYVYCENVDALFIRATKAGVQALMPPETMFWGDRMCRLKDPDGHEWCFATHIGEHAAKPEHYGCC